MHIVNRVGVVVVGLALSVNAAIAAADVVAVVSARNPLSTLNNNQVVDIFLGKTSRFPDGSQAAPIDQVEGSASRDEFYLKLAGKSPAQIKAHWSKIIFTGRGQPPQQAASGVEVKKLVGANPNAIGYIERDLVDERLKVLLVQ
jgi:ABC-type phosphate transport system substrate-binding protein